MLNTPILFLVFNRLDTTKQVFAKIREAQPRQLFVGADGARAGKEGEAEKVQAVRQYILDNVDWDCEVKTLFREQNLGCGRAVSEAITWFFENVEQGIILEDDCLPDLSFFTFCKDLLERYKEDERVFMVSGFNVLGQYDTKDSYIFSKLGAIWGWATWRRAWQYYDFELKLWEKAKETKMLENVLYDENQLAYRNLVFDNAKHLDTWDYQWTFARMSQSGLSIIPQRNLIRNLGFGEDATHTKQAGIADILDILPQQMAFPLQHPVFVVPCKELDDAVFYKTINYRIPHKTIINTLRKIKHFVKKVVLLRF